MTTNYDLLLERVLSLRTLTWRDATESPDLFRPASSDVIHLHGAVTDPSSIVFGHDGYTKVLQDPTAQLLERALGTFQSILFVGCGSGLGDPNFQSLRNWIQANQTGPAHRHYVLCREPERLSLADAFEGEFLTPLSYGAAYEDLEPFLRGLAPQDPELADRSRMEMLAPSLASRGLDDRVRREALLAKHMTDLEDRDTLSVLIPPILLPVPHEQFARSRQDGKLQQHQRADPAADAASPELIIVVGDENSGITSALEWLLAKAAATNSDAAPAMIDWRNTTPGVRPVEREVLKYLGGANALYDKRSPVPRYILALDNVLPRPTGILSRAIEDISKDACVKALLGCHSGNEAELCAVLDSAGVAYQLRYMGRLNREDTRALARLVAPSQANGLSRRALRIVRSERLPRTPFTISLLLSALLLGENHFQATTGTALLDAYVSLLLGQGDIHEDARLQVDHVSRGKILNHFAQLLAERRQGSLEESEVLDFLNEYFRQRDWAEEGRPILENLIQRRVLSRRGTKVGFSQSSYLHLFAAHMAEDSMTFRQHLLATPLYFSPVLRHYGALTRDDVETLKELDRQLLGEDGSIPDHGSRLFGGTSNDDADSAPETEKLERVLKSLDARELTTEDEDHRQKPEEDELDSWDDADIEPFPLDKIEDEPPSTQWAHVLALVSSFLRDSDSVTDLAVKERVLRKLLKRWGYLAEVVHDDDDFREMAKELLEQVQQDDARKEANKSGAETADSIEEMVAPTQVEVDEFRAILAAVYTVTGISATLSSKRLGKTLTRMADEDLSTDGDPRGALMGAFLAMDMQMADWPSVVRRLTEHHMHGGFVSVLVWRVCLFLYYNATLDVRHEGQLREMLVHATIQNRGVRDTAESREKISQQLKRNRQQQERFPKLGRGASPFAPELETAQTGEVEADNEES